MSSSVTPSPGASNNSTDKNLKEIQKQNKTQSALLFVNTLATAYNARQTSKLQASVRDLNNEIKNQTGVLEQISSTSEAILDENRRQTYLAEKADQQREFQKKIKNAIYNIRLEVDGIEKIKTALERNYLSTQLKNTIEKEPIDFNVIEEIEDKEFLRNILVKVDEIVEKSQLEFSEQEILDLERIQELKGILEGSVVEDDEKMTSELQELEGILLIGDEKIAKQYGIKNIREREHSYIPNKNGGWVLIGVLLFVLSVPIYFYTPATFILDDYILAILTFILGIVFCIVYSKKTDGLIAEISPEVRESINSQFYEEVDAVKQKIKLKIEVIKDKITEAKNKQLSNKQTQDEFESLTAKYPLIEFEKPNKENAHGKAADDEDILLNNVSGADDGVYEIRFIAIGPKKINVAKIVRQEKSLSLREAVKIVEDSKCFEVQGSSKMRDVVTKLESEGAIVETAKL